MCCVEGCKRQITATYHHSQSNEVYMGVLREDSHIKMTGVLVVPFKKTGFSTS